MGVQRFPNLSTCLIAREIPLRKRVLDESKHGAIGIDERADAQRGALERRQVEAGGGNCPNRAGRLAAASFGQRLRGSPIQRGRVWPGSSTPRIRFASAMCPPLPG